MDMGTTRPISEAKCRIKHRISTGDPHWFVDAAERIGGAGRAKCNPVQAGCQNAQQQDLRPINDTNANFIRLYPLERVRSMSEDNLDWLREHMMDRVTRSAAGDPVEKIVAINRRQPGAGTSQGAAALDLVYQAAEAISGIELRANETAACAQSLVKSAIEKLHLAESRIQSAENARRTTIDETAAQIQEAVDALKQAGARVEAAEARASAAETRARAAEARTSEAEAALKRIEDAIRTQLLGTRRAPAGKLSAAA
jgi:hypothetical protein